ncbi:hypothetical protein DPEC_G00370280 [Dallia pectoralis]|nr:hypothetical protein DPEC_G00370280 [Dallia pectoralis]
MLARQIRVDGDWSAGHPPSSAKRQRKVTTETARPARAWPHHRPQPARPQNLKPQNPVARTLDENPEPDCSPQVQPRTTDQPQQPASHLQKSQSQTSDQQLPEMITLAQSHSPEPD